MIIIYNNKQTFNDIVKCLTNSLAKLGLNFQIIDQISNKKVYQNKNNLYILFGIHDYDGYLPKKYIVYQFEQTSSKRGESRYWFSQKYIRILKGAIEIWDYSIRNIQNLKSMGLDSNKIKYVPLAYSQVLDKIPRLPVEEKQIDVLFYGSVNSRRMKIFNNLTKIGIKADFNWNNLWGSELDQKIANAKIVLNIHFYTEPILETSRLQYLISNQCFVISEKSYDPVLDNQYKQYIVFTDYDYIVETCIKYLTTDKIEREKVAEIGYQKYKSKLYSEVIPIDSLNKYNEINKTVDETETVDADTELLNKINGTVNRKNRLNKKNSHKMEYMIAETLDDPESGGKILKLPDISFNDLPTVSIITLTYNRSELFPIALRNYRLINYPLEKLEWIVVDDSNKYHQEQIDQSLNGLIGVNFIKLDQKYPISEKRNIGVSQARGSIIVHMDDDDYYPPQSVLARVKLLLKYKDIGAKCVGSCQIGIYNIIENYSYLMDTPFPAEASMAYFKSFWKEQAFPNVDVPEGEGIPFVTGRTKHVINMPYMFNLIAITHNKNITGKFRTINVDRDEKFTNFSTLWDFDTQLFFINILSKITKEKERIECK